MMTLRKIFVQLDYGAKQLFINIFKLATPDM